MSRAAATASEPRPAALLALATGLATAAAAVNGYGRFGYALLLPDMRGDLDWSLTTAGALNTGNALGYLAGAVLTALIVSRLGERVSLLVALGLTTVSVLGSALTGALAAQLVLRLLAGIGAAVTFVVGGAVVARLSKDTSPRRAALLLGVYFSGPGLGIATSGLLVPWALQLGGWRAGWLTLGGLALLCWLCTAATLARVRPAARPADGGGPGRWPASAMVPLLACYAVYGTGYIAYMTFVVALLGERGAGPEQITVFWVLLGLAAVLGGFAWSPVFGALPGGAAVAVVLGVTTLGAALPLWLDSPVAHLASAVVFGSAFLSVVTAVTACARRNLEPRHWTAAIAWLTVAFAVGQSAGPLLAGLFSDAASGVRTGLLLGAGLLLTSALLALAQRGHRVRETRRTVSDEG